MRVLLIPVDGLMPNLALMKLSTYHKSRGDVTGLRMTKPDKVYVSCIFQKNLSQALGVKSMYPDVNIEVGGPACYKPTHIPVEAEHVMPDYSLYPEMNYSLGYTTRGCPNACPFCIVPQIEGEFKEYAPISEFHNPDFSNLVLWDNNFLYSKLWREKLDYIESQGLKVCFNQGLDARLVDEDKAKALKDSKCYGLSFKSKRYYFAWDLMQNSDAILKGFQTLIDAGVKPYTIMSYVLVGYNTTHQEDLYRFTKLRELKIDPFIMVYNNRRDDEWIRHFSRWVNKRIYKACSIEDYNDGVLIECTS